MWVLLKGLILGFSIAAPVGPIGVLCIRRTLAYGRWHGLVSGLGAATADFLYGCVAAFGLTIVSDFLLDYASWIRLFGGLFLIYLGVTTLRSKPAEQAAEAQESTSLLGAYASTLVLTLTNPVTILAFTAIFAGLGLVGSSRGSAGILVMGVFIGSAAWWLLLSAMVSLFRHRFTARWLQWVNWLSGGVILLFGIVQLIP